MSDSDTSDDSSSSEDPLKAQGFKLIRKLNGGSFSKVYLSTYVSPTTQEKIILACKIINTKKTATLYNTKFLPRELSVLMACNHPHIIFTHSIFQNDGKYFIFMRYAERGDLHTYLNENKAMSEQQSATWTRQIALALQYLHVKHIAHRDLKCENVLITKNFNAKLTDFGFAKLGVRGSKATSETFCGSIAYVPPEVIKGKPYHPKIADMWSLGVMVYAMLNRTYPFDCVNFTSLYADQINRRWKFRKYSLKSSPSAIELVQNLLEPIENERWTIDQVLECNWLQTYCADKTPNPDEVFALKEAKQSQIKEDNDILIGCTIQIVFIY